MSITNEGRLQLMWRKTLKILLGFVLVTSLNGCAVIAVADAAVSVAATAVKTTVKVGAAAVDAVIPDKNGDEKKDK